MEAGYLVIAVDVLRGNRWGNISLYVAECVQSWQKDAFKQHKAIL